MEIEILENDRAKIHNAFKIVAQRLSAPFIPTDLEWRVERAGAKNGNPWALVLVYVTNRAIMQRLDEVCGIENWKNEFIELPQAFMCGLSIRLNGEWITKYDGAQQTNIEAIKGGFSGSMKRAAVQWGIGRYLYNLDHAYADIKPSGRFWQKGKEGKYQSFNWDPPALPGWALPIKQE